MEEAKPNPTVDSASLVNSFCEITSSSKEEALFFLESHQWGLDAAVSTFFDNGAAASHVSAPPPRGVPSPSQSDSPDYAPSPTHSPSRSRSPSPAPSRPPYQLRARRAADEKRSAENARGIRTLADLNRGPPEGSDSESDDAQDYYTGGEKSGMLVRDPSKPKDVDSILNQAKKAGAVEASSDYPRPSTRPESFTGTARLLTGESISHAPQPPEVVTHNVTFWRNGFTVDDGPLRRLDDPANAPFIQSVMNSQYPAELQPADMRTKVDLHLIKRDENYSEPKKRQAAFQGPGRTVGSTSSSGPPSAQLTTAPLPSRGIVVDDSSPTTSIQLRLADGTRMVSRFNYHHTIQDIHGFIDASRPGGARSYQLLTMGFPPKQLTDLSQTIEQAGIANSVVIQKI